MMHNLTGVYYISKSFPCLGFPIFSRVGSNKTFVQDLDPVGTIRRFLVIDPDHVTCIYYMMPVISVDVGDKGIFILLENETFAKILGNRSDAVKHFSEVSYAGSVLEIEAAHLIESQSRLESALAALPWGESDSLASWRNRETLTFERLIAARRNQKVAGATSSAKFEEEFGRLTAQPESSEWSRTWLKLWQQEVRRDQLIKIACWRVDSGYPPQSDGGFVYYNALLAERTDYVLKHCYTWLSQADIRIHPWISICALLRDAREFRQKIDELVIARIMKAAPRGSAASSQWRSLWNFAWNRGIRKPDLFEAADKYFREQDHFVQPDGDMLLLVVRDADNLGRFAEYVEGWLGALPRNSLVWTDLYLRLIDFGLTKRNIEIGERWLYHLGGTTNRWETIWRALEDHIEPDFFIVIAVDWLVRSRWDLRTWPKVFCYAASKVSSTSHVEEFLQVGRSWARSGFGHGRPRMEVEKWIRYVEDQPTSGQPEHPVDNL